MSRSLDSVSTGFLKTEQKAADSALTGFQTAEQKAGQSPSIAQKLGLLLRLRRIAMTTRSVLRTMFLEMP